MVSVVQKPFDGPGNVPLPVGTVVDSSDWRNEQRLHGSRYLRAATERESRELKKSRPADASA